MLDRNARRAGRKIVTAVTASVALLGLGVGVSQAATVPPRSHSGVVVMRNDTNSKITDYKLQYADPMTGLYGFDPVGDGEVYAVHWTWVSKNQANGTRQVRLGSDGQLSERPS